MAVVAADTRKPMYLRGLREPRIGFSAGRTGSGLGDDYVDPGYIDPATGVIGPNFIVATDPTPFNFATDPLPLDASAPIQIDPSLDPNQIDPLTGNLYSDETASEQQAAIDELAKYQSGQLNVVGPTPGTTYGPSNIAQDAALAAAAAKAAAGVVQATTPATKPATPYQPPASSQGQPVVLPAGSSPRVGVQSASMTNALKSVESALTAQSIPGVPNYALIGGGLILLMVLGRTGSGRRRR